ncbi:hypothetical protein [Ideonella sp. BN130291]|uniref:hypothetical protein n=1 Tax=Ideonella sp. BN130291 TaxID=3112940 RepID=UPI002E25ABB2|nr:hypothetical protein [Ideonella sp. BN130291]
MATFGIHFDGPITVDHKVSIRVLAKTYEHMQRAIDRAYLIEKHGDVWKHARLKDHEYQETEFIAEYPREGGIILDAVRAGAGAIVDRVAAAIRPVFEGAVNDAIEQQASIAEQLADRRDYVGGMRANTPRFEDLLADPPDAWASGYSNRSVVKEIDQLVAQVTPDRLDGSIVEITLRGRRSHLPFEFDAQIARRFHKIAARKELGAAFAVNTIIRTLDRGNRYARPSAKILNLASGREVVLHLSSQQDCDALHPYHNGREVRLFVCPIIEALGFDLMGGDLMFLSVA